MHRATRQPLKGDIFDEMIHTVKVCLSEKSPAHSAIILMREIAAFGPDRWEPLSPRVHYFTDFWGALANALLAVRNDQLDELKKARVQLKDLLIAVQRRLAQSSDHLYCYSVNVGVCDGFSYCRVQDGVAAALNDLAEEAGEPPIF